MLKEYTVTLHKHEDLADFYEDMETPGGNLFIPNRAVEVCNRRLISRNTHYILTHDEAQMLKSDDRVWGVELTELIANSIKPAGYKITNGTFSKDTLPDVNDINWGLLRESESSNRANWGADGTTNIVSDLTITASGKHVDVVIFDGHIDPAHPEFAVNSDGSGGSRVIQYNWFQNNIGSGTGTYVYTPYIDVAPVAQTFVFQNPGFAYTITGFDGTNPAITLVRGVTYTFNFQSVTSGHPIALRLSNGNTSAVPGTTGNNPSGGAWGSSATVTYAVPLDAPNSIVYQCVFHSSMIGTVNIVDNTFDPQLTDHNDHGCHVAGTVAGNTQGWARDANIYNISIYPTNPNNGTAGLDARVAYWDYVRAWHNSKPVNPVTGRKNPTITNHSYSRSAAWGPAELGEVTRVFYRGVDFNPGRSLTLEELRARGFYANNLSPTTPAYFAALESDIQDAINDGMIVVAAAGNDSWKIVNESDQDYNNTLSSNLTGEQVYFLNRGAGPLAGYALVITVGAVSNNRLENKALFSNCGSQVDVYAAGEGIQSSLHTGGYTGGSADPRNASYRKGKLDGTSMASPQVCGILTLLAESWPNMTQAQARDWIINNSNVNQMLDTETDDPMDTISLQGSQNLFARWYNQRAINGFTFPQKNFRPRPTSGITYPRTRIRKRG